MIEKLPARYWSAGNSTNLEVVAAELTSKINELIDYTQTLTARLDRQEEAIRNVVILLDNKTLTEVFNSILKGDAKEDKEGSFEPGTVRCGIHPGFCEVPMDGVCGH